MDLYKQLGVDRSSTPEHIRKAYRKKAARLHPDNQQTGNKDAFLALAIARDTLLDDDARARYDATGSIPKKPTISAAVAMIRNIAVSVAAEDPNADLLRCVRERLGKQIEGCKRSIGKCDTAIANVEKRWNDGEIKQHIIDEFITRREATMAQQDLSSAAMKLLEGCRYLPIEKPLNDSFLQMGSSIWTVNKVNW